MNNAEGYSVDRMDKATGKIIIRTSLASIQGYKSYCLDTEKLSPIDQKYVVEQENTHYGKVDSFLFPIIEALSVNVRTVLDVGCGVGFMVRKFNEKGYEAYGVDVSRAVESWIKNDMPKDKYFVVDSLSPQLPFADNVFDVVYSLGVIEHVGTINGSDRLSNYDNIRKKWLLEIFRVVKKGGYLVIGGPNKKFPIDTHGPDSRASRLEWWLYRRTGLSIHKVWGEHFLWSYSDVRRYLAGLEYDMKALSIEKYYSDYNHVPPIIRPLFKLYLKALPKSLLDTGLNPWMMVEIRKQ